LGEAVTRQQRDMEVVRRHASIEETGTNPVEVADRNYPPYLIKGTGIDVMLLNRGRATRLTPANVPVL
jgi:UDP-glucose 4-epimerase